MALRFEFLARSAACGARRGRVTTAHGSFETPAFMPVGTRGTVKGILPQLLASTGAQICLGNTYHLLLRPGPERVAGLGGLHAMMAWPAPILTDSGGYQAYSMADTNKIDDSGVAFRSIVDGSRVHLSPERAIEVQNALGADIIMALDDCPPSQASPVEVGGEGRGRGAGKEAANDAGDPRLKRVLSRDRVLSPSEHAARLREANERTIRWLERCRVAHGRAADQSLFGIVQGGTDLEQRTWSVERVCGVELPGYAIGGVAVGETSGDIARVVAHTAPLMPDAKPRYLMGVGYERDLLAAVRAGVDMFDCVLPTRNGRNANAFTATGQVRLRNAKFADDSGPIEAGCDCVACAGWGAAGGRLFAAVRPGRGGDSGQRAAGSEQRTLGSEQRAAGSEHSEERAVGGWGVAGGGGHFSRAYLRHLFMAEEMLGPMLVSLHNLRYFQRFMADLRATIETDAWGDLLRRYPVAAAAE